MEFPHIKERLGLYSIYLAQGLAKQLVDWGHVLHIKEGNDNKLWHVWLMWQSQLLNCPSCTCRQQTKSRCKVCIHTQLYTRHEESIIGNISGRQSQISRHYYRDIWFSHSWHVMNDSPREPRYFRGIHIRLNTLKFKSQWSCLSFLRSWF